MNIQIINFFKEAIYRLRTKSPRFFYILQLFAAGLTAASKLPGILERWTTLIVSPQFVHFCDDISKYAAGFLLATLLSSETKQTAITEDGSVIKKLEEKKYPFTTTSEKKKAAKEEAPVVKDPLSS